MNYLLSSGCNHFKTKRFRLPLQISDLLLLILLLIRLQALLYIRKAILEHPIIQHRQLTRRRHRRHTYAPTRTKTTVKTAQGQMLTLTDGLRTLPKNLAHPILVTAVPALTALARLIAARR